MTGSAFLKRLKFKLDFLSPEDKKTVLAYYEKKLADAKSKSEEEEIVKSFGAPESVAEELKKTFLKKESPSADGAIFDAAEQLENDSSDASMDEAIPAPESDSESIVPEQEEPSELIFSKPSTPESSPEFVQSMENKESTTLFGEKVVINERISPIEEIPLEPIDEANGLTPEEIEQAKVDTLEKAKRFDGESADHEEFERSGEKTPFELDPEEEPQVKEFPGILNKLFENSKLSSQAVTTFTVILRMIAFPLLLLAFGIGVFGYAALSAVVIAVALFAFALIAALVICGVVELIHGCTLLFQSVTVALIELGLGTVLFSLVTALSALVHEFLFGIVPKILKFLTVKFKRYLKVLYCYLYGGVA